MKKIGLLFDTSVEYGSKEHFFHFMWGYLLPALSILKIKNKPSHTQYYFETCGPIMNKVIFELLVLLDIQCPILSKRDFSDIAYKEKIPRWDLYLLHKNILGIEKGDYTHIAEFQKNAALIITLLENNFEQKFTKQIFEIKDDIINAVKKTTLYATLLQENKNQILLIQRSESPLFYTQHGEAEIKGYGIDRRSLVDVNEFITTSQKTIPRISLYEPGKHSIVHQICSIYLSNGLLGIKGAEFANLLWLKKKSRVLLIRPSCMKTPPVQNNLATLLELDFTELVSEDQKYPSLMNLNIEKHLS